MAWFQLNFEARDRESNCQAVVGVVMESVIAATRRLFGCFRIKDTSRSESQSNLIAHDFPDKEPALSRNADSLSSLFLPEEEDEASDLHCKEVENQDTGTPKPEWDTKEIVNQAKFLKACGTLPETPLEIRKVNVKCKNLSAQMEHSKFSSQLSDTAVQNLNLDFLPDQPPTPIKTNGELETGSASLMHTPSSCRMDGQSDQSVSKSCIHGSGSYNTPTSSMVNDNQALNNLSSSASPPSCAPSVQYIQKSVRFDCKTDLSLVSSKRLSSEVANQNTKQFELPSNYHASKSSPYPTPLKLTDEMQTPGTVFPAYLDNIAIGKAARIRTQYVYPALHPVENVSQLNESSDEDSYSSQDSSSTVLSSYMSESGQMSNEAKMELGTSGFTETSDSKDSKEEASLSSWLKSPSFNREESKQNSRSVYEENVHYGKTPGDRPIIGMVADHCNDENSRMSPYWWDGNGIPNSTHKYKEDQKVSWHATPFEQRLEKALSAKTSISQRNRKAKADESGVLAPDCSKVK